MLKKILTKVFGDQHDRALKKVQPILSQVLSVYKTLSSKSDDEIRNRVIDIKEEIQSSIKPYQEEIEETHKNYIQEPDEDKKETIGDKLDDQKKKLKDHIQNTLDNYLPEVYAIVKDTCRRLVGHKYRVRDSEETWHMVPFDVQIIGGIALHQGFIAEMATGEGKTLVATFPLFLNALTGRGVHLITVNDYLAQRDSEWMKPIFEFHGINVGCIVNGMRVDVKQEAYNCDITYGTNSEFGFDYLRDNMARSKEELVQRDLFFCIIDEVDSVLIDEARTPLIISGPVAESKNFYPELKPYISKLVNAQNMMANRFVSDAKKLIDSGDWDPMEVGEILLKVKRAAPKNKQLMKLTKDSDVKKSIQDVEGYYLRDKKMHVLDEELFYVIDEHAHSADLCEKGQNELHRYDQNLFVVEQLDDMLEEVDRQENLPDQDKAELKEEATQRFLDKSEKLHNISQLLRSYSLFEKDVDYVVQDNKVMIVDEFTGRLMPGRRFSEGLHQALEAKEGVKIEGATQTLATITYQNLFRMYDKLAGMTGTAITEEAEFVEIYNLPCMLIPTNLPITRIDYNDVILMTKLEKYKAIIEEIEYWHERKKPVLVGTVSVDVSETLSRLLSRKNIKHNVLNAKQHEKEADVVKNAGQPGAVTIATNMAGRGTDIKLGETVITQNKKDYLKATDKISEEFPFGQPIDGLHVIGTERHESRRIDRQLRGRAGRQGDPGTSRFYLSLEDDLMRLFGSEKIAPMLKKFGFQEGEKITHTWMTSTVEKAQKRVEGHNFNIRKQLIKYDEVMNQQREVIYNFRRNVLKGYDLKNIILEMIRDTIDNIAMSLTAKTTYEEEWDITKLYQWINHNLNLTMDPLSTDGLSHEGLSDKMQEFLITEYDKREEQLTSEIMRKIEHRSLLDVVDSEWRDHLHEMDLLKDGIGMRAYANKDPLIEFKKESFKLFETLIARIYENVTKKVYTTYIVSSREQLESLLKGVSTSHANITAYSTRPLDQPAQETHTNQQSDPPPKVAPRRVDQKVGRNDPCPCGSGKKFKKCCGAVSSQD